MILPQDQENQDKMGQNHDNACSLLTGWVKCRSQILSMGHHICHIGHFHNVAVCTVEVSKNPQTQVTKGIKKQKALKFQFKNTGKIHSITKYVVTSTLYFVVKLCNPSIYLLWT